MPTWGGPPCGRSHLGLRWGSLWGHKTSEGCARMDPSSHADATTGAFGGVPYGATKRVRGVLKWGGPPCGRSQWGLRWSSLWDHEMSGAPKWGGPPRGRSHWGLRWSSLWGHEACEWCARRDPSHYADAASGAFGGAPYGATETCEGCAELGAGAACGRSHWGLRWSSL